MSLPARASPRTDGRRGPSHPRADRAHSYGPDSEAIGLREHVAPYYKLPRLEPDRDQRVNAQSSVGCVPCAAVRLRRRRGATLTDY